MPDDIVVFESDPSIERKVTCGDAAYNILTLSAADYPELPEVEDEFSVQIQQRPPLYDQRDLLRCLH